MLNDCPALVCPPWRPEPPSQGVEQDGDRGVFDVCFDADIRRQLPPPVAAHIGGLTIDALQDLTTEALTDSSTWRNYAWLRWWQACSEADRLGHGHLVAGYAPHECRGRPAHARHIKAQTTRLRRAIARAQAEKHGSRKEPA
jgi:hypothetical protein